VLVHEHVTTILHVRRVELEVANAGQGSRGWTSPSGTERCAVGSWKAIELHDVLSVVT